MVGIHAQADALTVETAVFLRRTVLNPDSLHDDRDVNFCRSADVLSCKTGFLSIQ